jgi:hypothetical protein
MVDIKILNDTAYKFLMDTDFNRIKAGKYLDMSKKPYDIKLLENMIIFYENEEEYEKCEIIFGFKSSILDHDKNYSA